MYEYQCLRRPKRTLNSLEVKLYVVVSSLVWVLVTELRASLPLSHASDCAQQSAGSPNPVVFVLTEAHYIS